MSCVCTYSGRQLGRRFSSKFAFIVRSVFLADCVPRTGSNPGQEYSYSLKLAQIVCIHWPKRRNWGRNVGVILGDAITLHECDLRDANLVS